jgi:hypothetical protein
MPTINRKKKKRVSQADTADDEATKENLGNGKRVKTEGKLAMGICISCREKGGRLYDDLIGAGCCLTELFFLTLWFR